MTPRTKAERAAAYFEIYRLAVQLDARECKELGTTTSLAHRIRSEASVAFHEVSGQFAWEALAEEERKARKVTFGKFTASLEKEGTKPVYLGGEEVGYVERVVDWVVYGTTGRRRVKGYAVTLWSDAHVDERLTVVDATGKPASRTFGSLGEVERVLVEVLEGHKTPVVSST